MAIFTLMSNSFYLKVENSSWLVFLLNVKIRAPDGILRNTPSRHEVNFRNLWPHGYQPCWTCYQLKPVHFKSTRLPFTRLINTRAPSWPPTLNLWHMLCRSQNMIKQWKIFVSNDTETSNVVGLLCSVLKNRKWNIPYTEPHLREKFLTNRYCI